MSAAKRFGAYHRISQLNGRDAEDNLSSVAAFEQIDAWATMRGVEIVERYQDTDSTGSKLERPELARLLADLKSGAIDGVVVAKVDRLSRANVADALKLVREIHELAPDGLAVLDLGLDPATETGELVLGVLLMLSRFQWRRYQSQWADQQSRAVKAGVWIGPAPLGYRRGDDGRLELDATAPIVAGAFRVAAADGMHAAGDYLAERAPGKRWRKSDVRRVLRNRAYLGEHHAGGPGHEPLVEPAVFAAAQSEPAGKRSNGAYPLSHVATCANCGAGLVGALQTVRGKSYRRMRCSATCAGGVGSISADALESHVRGHLAAALDDTRFRLRFDAAGGESAADELERAELARTTFAVDTEARDLLGEDAWRAGLRAHAAAVKAAEEQVATAAAASRSSARLPGPAELDDPAKFADALVAIGSLVVAGGRGPIDERVELEWIDGPLDLDDGVGVLAA